MSNINNATVINSTLTGCNVNGGTIIGATICPVPKTTTTTTLPVGSDQSKKTNVNCDPDVDPNCSTVKIGGNLNPNS